MVNVLVCIICAVLMILGAAELIRLVILWLTRPMPGTCLSVVAAPRSGEDCESAVRAAAQRMDMMELRSPCKLICLNAKNDPEISRICTFLKHEYPALEVCGSQELAALCAGEEE